MKSASNNTIPNQSASKRILCTPSPETKEHLLFVQEIGFWDYLDAEINQHLKVASYLLIVTTKGTGVISCNGQEHILSRGDILLIDCQDDYSGSFHGNWEFYWIHFYGGSMPYYYENILNLSSPLLHLDDVTRITHIIESIMKTYQSPASFIEAELKAASHLTTILSLFLFPDSSQKQIKSASTKRLEKINTYIKEHFTEKISLEFLAENFYISKYHLSREYKKKYGVTIVQYIVSLRITLAKSKLRFSEDSIESIAIGCGFTDASYFNKIFQKYEGMSPLSFRKKWRK